MGNGGGSIFGLLIFLAVIIFLIFTFWKVFTNAGKPGWASLIPIYNIYIIFKIAGKPGWWLLLLLLPVVNIIISIVVSIALAKKFGKSPIFGLGLAFLGFIFYPVLAFSSAQYQV